MSEYSIVLLLSLILPLILSFFAPLKFYQNIRALVLSISITLVLFGGWDVFATQRGHWYFNQESVWKLKIINLPLEEWMFFIVIPFCCIFTWEAIKYIKGRLK